MTVVDHLNRLDHRARGAARAARAHARRRHRRARDARGVRGGAARGRLPPRRADRRPPVGRGPLDGRARQRRRHRLRARAAARRRRRQVVLASTAGVYGDPRAVPTPRPSRSRRCRPTAPARRRPRATGPVRSPVRAVDALAADVERLRPAPEPARRGGRDRDLLRRGGSGARSRSSATAGRRATSSSSVTWRRRSCVPGLGREGAVNVCTGRETSLLELVARSGWTSTTVRGAWARSSRSCLDPRAAAEASAGPRDAAPAGPRADARLARAIER